MSVCKKRVAGETPKEHKAQQRLPCSENTMLFTWCQPWEHFTLHIAPLCSTRAAVRDGEPGDRDTTLRRGLCRSVPPP